MPRKLPKITGVYVKNQGYVRKIQKIKRVK